MIGADLPYETSLSALGEVEANARIRAGFDRIIVPNAQAILALEHLDKPAFGQLLKLKAVDPTVLYRGLLVQVCSIFGYFCRKTIENLVDEIAASATTFESLPERLVAANFVHTGLYFQKNRDAYLAGTQRKHFESLSASLFSCRDGQETYVLNAASFTEYLGNCTSQQLKKRFDEMGLDDPTGDKIGSFSELRTFFGGGGAREVSKKAKENLDSLLERRNSIVHSSTISETVTVDDVEQAVQFMRAVTGGIRQIVGQS